MVIPDGVAMRAGGVRTHLLRHDREHEEVPQVQAVRDPSDGPEPLFVKNRVESQSASTIASSMIATATANTVKPPPKRKRDVLSGSRRRRR